MWEPSVIYNTLQWEFDSERALGLIHSTFDAFDVVERWLYSRSVDLQSLKVERMRTGELTTVISTTACKPNYSILKPISNLR